MAAPSTNASMQKMTHSHLQFFIQTRKSIASLLLLFFHFQLFFSTLHAINGSFHANLPSLSPSTVHHVPLTSPIAENRASVPFSTIYMAALVRSRLYLNGNLIFASLRPKDFAFTTERLIPGDVISVYADSFHESYGLVVSIIGPTEEATFRTGHAPWRARKAFVIPGFLDAWMYPDYSVCEWLIANDEIDQWETTSYPDTQAKLIWAYGTDGFSPVFFRFRIGGENCSTDLTRSTFFVAADDSAIVYVNGVEIAKSTSNFEMVIRKTLSLNKGDVFAVSVSSNNVASTYGVIAAIVPKVGDPIVTGGEDISWLSSTASKAGHKTSWTQPDFDACDWKAPIISRTARKAPSFPKILKNAKYVWGPKGAGASDRVFLRHMVGGEWCSLTARMYRITFAADNVVIVYVNGIILYHLNLWKIHRYIDVRLSPGDVVAFAVSNYVFEAGLVAAVQPLKNATPGYPVGATGSIGEWRATKKFNTGTNLEWTFKRFDACNWPEAVTVTTRQSSPNFPYASTGAEYVWAANTNKTDKHIFLRYMIGGESRISCNQERVTVHFSGDDKAKLFLNGELRASTRRWKDYKRLDLRVSVGDVLAFELQCRGGGYGLTAAVVYRDDGSQTSVTGDVWKKWRAVRAEDAGRGAKGGKWRKPGFRVCGWETAHTTEATVKTRVSRDFPVAETKAKPVWATGAVCSDKVYIRHRIGGDFC